MSTLNPPALPGPPPGSFAYLYAQLTPGDEHAHDRGVQFERVVRWLLANDPVLAHEVVAVWRWEQWPDRFHHGDIGVDFVVALTGERLLAVQAKAWEDRPTYRDLATFFSATTVRDGQGVYRFAKRLIISPSGVSGRIPPAILHAITDTSVWDADTLDALGLTWPTSLDLLPTLTGPTETGEVPASERHELRDYQRAAVAALTETYASSDRAQLVMACGTGKTLVGQRLTEQLTADAEVVVVAAPSLALLAQLRREWARDATRPIAVLPVCSESNLAEEGDEALATAHTTDPDQIAAWLTDPHGGSQPIVFATYHSLERVRDALDAAGRRCALLVCDEAHRLAGRPDERFAVATDDAFPADRRLFATATPRLFTVAASGADGSAVSMDDEQVFGPVAFRYGFGQAVREGRLTDYQLVALDVDQAAVAAAVDQRTLAEVAGVQVTAELVAQVAGTVRAVERYGLRRVVVFHHRVADVKAHVALLAPVAAAMGVNAAGWWTDAIVGTTSPAGREACLRRLRDLPDGQVGVVATARVLSEGVDVPALDAVVFADPRSSQVDVVQAVGRVMRTAPGKQRGHVIVPIVVDPAAPETSLARGAFAPVARTLAALADHDELLREQLDAVRRALGRRPGTAVGGLGARTGGKVAFEFDSLSGADLAAFVNAVSVALVEKTTLSFEFWFGMLEAYVAEHSTSDVRGRLHDPQWGGLAAWLIQQVRPAGRGGALSATQMQRLEGLPGWSWGREYGVKGAARKPRVVISFPLLLDLLAEYRRQNGHVEVPGEATLTVDGIEYPLGSRVHTARKAARAGKLSAEELGALDDLGFIYAARNPGWHPRQLGLPDEQQGSRSTTDPAEPPATGAPAQLRLDVS